MRWALLSLGMLAACSSWSGEGEDEDQAPPEPVTVVQTQVVTVGDVADRLLTSATIEAAASADITAEATGTVVSTKVMCCTHSLWLPQASVAFHVRSMPCDPVQLAAIGASA